MVRWYTWLYQHLVSLLTVVWWYGGHLWHMVSVMLPGTPSIQFSSVAQSCPTLCDPMNRSTPGLPVHHQLLEFTQTHAHRVGGAIQPSHPLSSPSPPAPNPSQHQGLFQWVSSSHEVAKVLEFPLQHQELLQLPLNRYLIPCSWEQRCASHSWVDKDRNRPNNILG